MKRIIDHVNSKPEHIRHLTAIGCTAVVGAVLLGFWFHSFQTTTYALLNPDQQPASEQAPAVAETSPSSLFGTIGNFISDIKAEISGIFSGQTQVQTSNQIQTDNEPAGAAHPLPVSN